jgi:very-short-patch-repair endonuclease
LIPNMPHRDVSKLQRSRARTLRHDMTDAERRLWYRLRAHRFGGLSFRRQVPIGPYIADFVCFDARLVVEVDGGQHASQSAYDTERDAWLRSQGFVVLRFWNNDVLVNTQAVLEQIAKIVVQSRPPSLTLPRKGGGDWSSLQ